MIFETIGAACIGVMVARGCWEAWKGRRNLQTGDPERWARYFERNRGNRRYTHEIKVTVSVDCRPGKRKIL